MPNRKEILMESVKKLIELGMKDSDIITQLKDVGVNEKLAKELIAEARNTVPEPIKETAEQKEFFENPSSSEEVLQDVYGAVGSNGLNGNETEKVKKMKSKIQVDAGSGSRDIAELWRQGILTTIDSKIGEMERIRKDVDAVIDDKISNAIKKETDKIKVLFDSQKSLLLDNIKNDLEAKGNEVVSVVEGKLIEIKEMGELTRENLLEIKKESESNRQLQENIDKKLTDIDEIRSKLIRDMNRAIMEAETKVEKLVNDISARLDDVDERVNRSLELESKVTEGLLKDAQMKIDRLSMAKTEELVNVVEHKTDKLLIEAANRANDMIAKMNTEMKHLKELSQNIKLEQITKAITELDDLKVNIAKDLKNELAKLYRQTEAKQKQLVSEMNIIQQRLQAKSGDIDKLEAEIKQRGESKMQELIQNFDVFKDQFVATIERNVQKFNAAKLQMGESLKQRDTLVEEKLKLIDMKMNELDEFEKRFAEEMGVIMDKTEEKQDNTNNQEKDKNDSKKLKKKKKKEK